jgi:hypothetical protein
MTTLLVSQSPINSISSTSRPGNPTISTSNSIVALAGMRGFPADAGRPLLPKANSPCRVFGNHWFRRCMNDALENKNKITKTAQLVLRKKSSHTGIVNFHLSPTRIKGRVCSTPAIKPPLPIRV